MVSDAKERNIGTLEQLWRSKTKLIAFQNFGGDYRKDTPVPIPNTAVKLPSADDTWLVTARENR